MYISKRHPLFLQKHNVCFCGVFKKAFSERSAFCNCALQETIFYEQLDFHVQYVVQYTQTWTQIQALDFDQLLISSIIKEKDVANLIQLGLQSLNILAVSCHFDKETAGKENGDGKEVRLSIKYLL